MNSRYFFAYRLSSGQANHRIPLKPIVNQPEYQQVCTHLVKENCPTCKLRSQSKPKLTHTVRFSTPPKSSPLKASNNEYLESSPAEESPLPSYNEETSLIISNKFWKNGTKNDYEKMNN